MKRSTQTSLVGAVTLPLTATATAVTLLGAGQNTHYWGELTTPALLAAGLLAFMLGSLVFTPTKRRQR